MAARLPPGCGLDIGKTIYYNVYQAEFHKARRLRHCLICRQIGAPALGGLQCPTCLRVHQDNTTFPRLYSNLHLRAGRRSGKSLAGAHAVREELTIGGQKWWVTGPTFKHLHDATMPTLLRLIPEKWVKNWNQDNLELTIINGSVVQFRSLDDPERARGQGLTGVWLDEAAFTAERAWQVLEPSLAENAGVAISTTSPAGFDWTYDTFFKKAVIDKEPGYWAAQFETLDNPLFQQNPVLQAKVEAARRSLPPDIFAAEYQGRDVNFSGSVYGALIEAQVLDDEEAVKALIPEWPNINSTRPVVIGLDSGADHPFGALLVVATEGGLVVVGEYLERLAAMMTHLAGIQGRFATSRFANIKWAANKNEAQLRLEFALRGVGVVPAENKHQIGIQRVQTWLTTKQLFFVRSRCPLAVEQLKAYRYADNFLADGQKREQEQVFKKRDELPDALRYALMAWPELPKADAMPMTERELKRWNALDAQSRLDITRIREYNAAELKKFTERGDKDYPVGEFFGGGGGNVDGSASIF